MMTTMAQSVPSLSSPATPTSTWRTRLSPIGRALRAQSSSRGLSVTNSSDSKSYHLSSRDRLLPLESSRSTLLSTSFSRRRVLLQSNTFEGETEAAQVSSSNAPSTPLAGGSQGVVAAEDDFNIAQLSFGTIGLYVGLALLGYGFASYFNFGVPPSSFSSLALIYGFIVSLLGFALKYAQLDPLECITYEDAQKLRDTQATDIQVQIRSDVTRYRYGDEQHMEEALERIFRVGKAGGIPRRSVPVLTQIREETTDGFYTLVLVFKSEDLKYAQWTERESKLTSFFGPGIRILLSEIPESKTVEVRIVSMGQGGTGKDTRPDVKPQLMPGLQPRKDE